MTTSYTKLAQHAIDAALRAGATGAICSVGRSEETSLEVESGQLKSYTAPKSLGVSLSVMVGQQLASVSSSNVSLSAIQDLAKRAVSMAQFTTPNPYVGLSNASQWATQRPALDLVDSAPLMSADVLKDVSMKMEARMAAQNGVEQGKVYAGTYFGESVTVNSNGLLIENEKTATSFTASALVGTGDNTFAAYYGDSQIHAADLEGWESIADEAVERSLSMLGAAPIDNAKKMPVFFDRRISSSLLSHLMSAIDGDAVHSMQTFLRDALNTEVFNPNITITDDPFVVRGEGSRVCDRQGVAMQKRELITRGVLNTWMLNINSANKLGLQSNGYASGCSNLTLANGTLSRDSLLNVEDGFLVTGFMGRGARIETGDYSRGAQGFLIKNGKIDRPVKGVTITGTLQDMFKAMVPADDLKIRGSVNAPTCGVGEMTVS